MTLEESFVQAGRAIQVASGQGGTTRWPSAKYRAEPVRFFREILGVQPWARQIDVIEAVRDHKRVAVSSGHKVSKSHTAAGIALWFYCSFDDARVVMSSTTSRQVDQILWREVRMMRARSREPIDGVAGDLARTGLKANDFREVVGFTAREAEAVAGISGKNLLYIIDEASGVDDPIFHAIEGNRAGGARILLFSNPTQNEGEFFEAFHGKKEFYRTIYISSEETPNVIEGRDVIPGLATREWVEEKKREWGEDSPMYTVRVKGRFAIGESAKLLSLHLITEAQKRWTPFDENDTGRLCIGLDPAGDSGTGDESAFAVRRGLKVGALYAHRGLTADAHLAHLLGMVRKYRRPREALPIVAVDVEGEVGARIYGRLRGYVDDNAGEFELVGVRSGKPAEHGAYERRYERIRDHLWHALRDWMRDGGAIPEDDKLAKELHAPESKRNNRGRDEVSPKDEMKRKLNRSPDRADAACLSVWGEVGRSNFGDDVPANETEEILEDIGDAYAGQRHFDPYAGAC